MNSIIKLCECECGIEIHAKDNQGRSRRFVHNHHRRIHPYIPDGLTVICACGCGTEIPAKDNWGESRRFLFGHQRIGTKHTESSLLKMSDSAKNMSKKSRQNIVEALKGRKLTEEHKRKIGEASKGNKSNLGKKPSEETRMKLSEASKGNKRGLGHKHSEETKRIIGEASIGRNKGVKGANWQGGISFLPYCPKFNEQFKEEIREMFNRECFLCSKTESDNVKKLSVHHITYDKTCLCSDIQCKFVPLCNSCHSKTNYNRDKWEMLIIDKLISMGR